MMNLSEGGDATYNLIDLEFFFFFLYNRTDQLNGVSEHINDAWRGGLMQILN